MEIARISSKGQIVIPRRIRESMKINAGSVLGFDEIDSVMVVRKIETDLKTQFKKSLADVKAGRVKKVA